MDPRVMKFANMPGASSHCPWCCNNTSNELIGYIKALIHSELWFYIMDVGLLSVITMKLICKLKFCWSWSGFWTEAVPLPGPGPPFLSPSMARIFYTVTVGGQPVEERSSMVVVYPWPGVYWGYLDHVVLICSDYTSHQPQHIITALHHPQHHTNTTAPVKATYSPTFSLGPCKKKSGC